MKIREQFSRNAKNYQKYSKIQQEGAELLINNLPEKIDTILDIGCGSGRIFNTLSSKKILFSKFYGIDFSTEMLQQHPTGDNIKLDIADFNSKDFTKYYNTCSIDIAISSSALQWADNIEKTLNTISKIAPKGAFFIFTSGTFKSLHKIVKAKSPIHDKKDVLSAFLKSYNSLKIEHFNFKLEFDDTLEMLRYIKKSGVSGGGFGLKYKEIKRVLKEYKLNYLEFEALLLIGNSKWK